MPVYLYALKDVQKIFDNTFYNGGFDLTMDEQDEYIKVLKGVAGFADFYDAGESYTPYVPFVVQLFSGHVKDFNMVRFFTILSLVHHFQKSFDLTLSILHY